MDHPPATPDRAVHNPTKVFRSSIIFLALIGAGLFFWRAIDAVLFAFIGILLAVILRALAGLLSRFLPISKKWSTLIVLILLVAAIGSLFWLTGSRISSQMSQLFQQLPRIINQLENSLRDTTLGRFLLQKAGNSSQSGSLPVLSIFSSIGGIAYGAFDFVVGVILTIFGAIFMAFDSHLYRNGLLMLVPKGKVELAKEVMDAATEKLRLWLLGTLASMVIIGTIVGVGLWLLGIPLALSLGIISGLLEFVPFFGAIVSSVPGILVGMSLGWKTALWVALFYFAVHQIEGDVVMPLVQMKAVALPPALVLFTVIAFGLVFGLLGFFIAAPVTVVAIEVVRLLYVRDRLGKSV